MALSDTARRILTEAVQHPLRLVEPPRHLPAAACSAVLRSLLKQDFVEERATPAEYGDLTWRQEESSRFALQVSEAGLQALGGEWGDRLVVDEAEFGSLAQAEHEAAQHALDTGTAPTLADACAQAVAAGIVPADLAQEPGSAPPAAPVMQDPSAPTSPDHAQAPHTAAPARASLRDAARRVLAAWEDPTGERASLADAMAALRAVLVKPTRLVQAPAAPRNPRQGTKQQAVLAMLRRTEGATVAQIAEATGWQPHTVRGFFAGLKKRQGIAVEVAERVRQVGPGKEGAKGSYTVYRVAEAG